ncbi:Schizosaccharomyces pombe specific protein [Schizosaccharomyces pombe]|uniref:Putative uncharacterized protein C27E2.12 n=1 Tax=Schizosaccharomyces pombe (strain 972 / ATCC 24843) TaxID=284812 RepID=YEIC_SCHPO|nr:uncharacterized protein SPAC27E2.12 [Schizosaccharomyces pombe]Q2EEM0.1 RecName: Full=Putative uncharacterized protein C27E2.12 [Schizosaccharomyces pombe 972h-]CAJ76914.1 sequence orphan [Schizosaccharomyces pombe]|eukprot:NP_001343018.1 uncharacterized protein SPAC27E2.12 [Schizosaccharomyces pombe]
MGIQGLYQKRFCLFVCLERFQWRGAIFLVCYPLYCVVCFVSVLCRLYCILMSAASATQTICDQSILHVHGVENMKA